MASHGLQKIQSAGGFAGWMGPQGPPPFLQALATAGEFFGGLGILFGVLTPLACLGAMSVMFVAVFSNLTNENSPTYFVKPQGASGDSFESALGYFVMALAIFLTGPGLLSVDAALTYMTNKRGAATSTP